MDKSKWLEARWPGLVLAFALCMGALGACTLPKGGGTDGPPI
jgi:hypothetical protein